MPTRERSLLGFLGEAARRFADATPRERAFLAAAWVFAPGASRAIERWGMQRTTRALGALDAPALAVLVPERATSARLGAVRAEELVRWAYAAHPSLRYTCLPASVLQYALERLVGDDVRLCIGVRRGAEPSSIDAHAWVELSSEPRALERDRFTVLHEIGGVSAGSQSSPARAST
jgi:hypothetical protein